MPCCIFNSSLQHTVYPCVPRVPSKHKGEALRVVAPKIKQICKNIVNMPHITNQIWHIPNNKDVSIQEPGALPQNKQYNDTAIEVITLIKASLKALQESMLKID